ncbi:MAG TPA: glycoside hydrolase family 20 zincin-like fold domain-containing protein, partial [Candidatus Saccharimonadales bacterium]|nr:glycoside hydrolase family 20 zincin-like fold domain-containing protein [Candidatus Saccharimonadales bacterium]
MVDPARYPVIPWPRSLEARDGAFAPAAGLTIALADAGNADLQRLAALLRGYLKELAGLDATVGARGGIALAFRDDAPPGAESYRLDITTERIELSAR